MLYPSYQFQWNLNPAIVTSVFATYQVSLLVVLLVFGSLSDRFGRRVVAIWGVGAMYLSLGAHMIGQFAQIDDTLLIGILLGCSSAAIGVTALLLGRVLARVCVLAGTALTVVRLAAMGAAAASGSIAVFRLWC